MEKWKIIKSEPLVDSRWVKVRKDSVDLPSGQHIDDFYAISLNDAAAIVALDDAGNIVLKKEYRYCLDRDLTVAKRELLEETGYVSDDWQYIGATVESSAKLTNYMHLFFANHCRKVSKQNLDPTEELDVLVVPLKQAVEMVMNNEICCNSSAHGILWAARKLGV